MSWGPSGSPVFEEEATSAAAASIQREFGEGNFEPNFVALLVVGVSVKFGGVGEEGANRTARTI